MSGAHGNIFYPQTRAASTLTTLIDADGKEVKVEVREDAELKTKLQEIIDLLVAAGYFRARIKGLSSFDKVVGGMTWCIETCNFDVDVDLLFQENLTIGQKIALTEKIVSVLPQMKCPHQIEPHQIQGLDFIHIFPVIQWLVKRSVETREEMGNMVRAFSISQFDKNYTIPEDQISQEKYLNGIKTINNVYRPVRRFRRKYAPPEDEESRVQSTLLEYGQRISSLTDSKNAEEETGGEPTQQMSAETQKIEEQRMQALMGSMASMDNQEGRLTAGMVGSIVSLQAQEIASAAKHYAELQAKRFEGGVVHTRAHASAALQRQKAILEEQEQALLAEKERIQKSLDEETERLETLRLARRKVELELADMKALENEENQGLLRKLQSLVILNESLKKQEVEFREQCKVELGRLQKMVKDAEKEELPDENSGQIAEQFKEENENFQRLRLALAKKNRSFAMLLRQLDEVPGRAELAQYQRRFLELYNQVGTKHKETKQFYTLYNTLDDTKLYFGKELTLLNSILDNYSEAMSSASSKEQFMKQFEAIVEGVKLNKSKVETLCNEERQRRDKLSQQLLSLVETQRSYVSAVRQLSIECRRNEALLAKLRGP